jgi:hypothetical protein
MEDKMDQETVLNRLIQDAMPEIVNGVARLKIEGQSLSDTVAVIHHDPDGDTELRLCDRAGIAGQFESCAFTDLPDDVQSDVARSLREEYPASVLVVLAFFRDVGFTVKGVQFLGLENVDSRAELEGIVAKSRAAYAEAAAIDPERYAEAAAIGEAPDLGRVN